MYQEVFLSTGMSVSVCVCCGFYKQSVQIRLNVCVSVRCVWVGAAKSVVTENILYKLTVTVTSCLIQFSFKHVT